MNVLLIATYIGVLAGILGWAYRKFRLATISLQDECPWSLEKKTRQIDFRARDQYMATAARTSNKEELFRALVPRTVAAVRSYTAIQGEMKDFERIKHLLTDSIRERELSNLHLVVKELETIEHEGNRLNAGWAVEVYRQATQIIDQQAQANETYKQQRQHHLQYLRQSQMVFEQQQKHQQQAQGLDTQSPNKHVVMAGEEVVQGRGVAPGGGHMTPAKRANIIEQQQRAFLEAMGRQQEELAANSQLGSVPPAAPMPFPRDPLTGEEYIPIRNMVNTPHGPQPIGDIKFLPASQFASIQQAAAAHDSADDMETPPPLEPATGEAEITAN